MVYKRKTYHFTHTKPVDFLSWNFLIDRFGDVRELLTAIINNANLIGIADEFPTCLLKTEGQLPRLKS